MRCTFVSYSNERQRSAGGSISSMTVLHGCRPSESPTAYFWARSSEVRVSSWRRLWSISLDHFMNSSLRSRLSLHKHLCLVPFLLLRYSPLEP
jgi:hypothetical protein